MVRDRKQDLSYQPREPFSNKLLMDRIRSISKLEKMKCTDDSIALTQFLERVRIFKFLSGLNPEFDPIRIPILGKENFPSLLEVFHIV